jgi:hypothetical protein
LSKAGREKKLLYRHGNIMQNIIHFEVAVSIKAFAAMLLC